LMPAEFAESPLPRVRAAFEWQYRLLPQSAAVSVPSPSVAVNHQDNPPRQGPRMGM
jgi:hypothetical protein